VKRSSWIGRRRGGKWVADGRRGRGRGDVLWQRCRERHTCGNEIPSAFSVHGGMIGWCSRMTGVGRKLRRWSRGGD
jgi:hypothetical protein